MILLMLRYITVSLSNKQFLHSLTRNISIKIYAIRLNDSDSTSGLASMLASLSIQESKDPVNEA